ncbi:cytochrome P450 family protein [Saccharopolyspora spinosa]|uniref:Cytochrome P450 n=1 Tax=Saccharopolyspora spinosa TaxID=60894 RepID=A0A2N3XUF7_SACSN|nr:cytochrome P450 [Saccharopolyspora spinosa]PKW14314.1 cytochrome P450 [Saccharopolyspora spinosa]
MQDLKQLPQLDDAYLQNTHALAARLRVEGPARQVVMPDGVRVWLVTTHAEARALLTDPRLSSDAVYDRLEYARAFAEGKKIEFSRSLAGHMLNVDPPDHTRLRKLVNKAFTSRTIAKLAPRIEEITAELLDAIPEGEPVDLITAFALPLPIKVICELMGIPAADQQQFATWSGQMVSTAAPEEIGAASGQMAGYLMGLAEQKRAQPADDLLSALVHASEDGDQLSVNELIAMTFVLLIGGYETTVNLISSGVFSLLQAPDQLAVLRENEKLLPNAIEEFLRFETPNNMASPRYTKEPVVVGDVEIPEGELVFVSLLAGNRDAARFPDPDRLDITRPTGAHLGFGHGIHYCVGAPLGRLEGEIAIGRLLERFSHIELATDPASLRWRSSTQMHGLESLPLVLRR